MLTGWSTPGRIGRRRSRGNRRRWSWLVRPQRRRRPRQRPQRLLQQKQPHQPPLAHHDHQRPPPADQYGIDIHPSAPTTIHPCSGDHHHHQQPPPRPPTTATSSRHHQQPPPRPVGPWGWSCGAGSGSSSSRGWLVRPRCRRTSRGSRGGDTTRWSRLGHRCHRVRLRSPRMNHPHHGSSPR